MSLLGGDDLQTSVTAPVVGPALALIKTSPYKQAAQNRGRRELTGREQVPGTIAGVEAGSLCGAWRALSPPPRGPRLWPAATAPHPPPGVRHVQVKTVAGVGPLGWAHNHPLNLLNRLGRLWLLA